MDTFDYFADKKYHLHIMPCNNDTSSTTTYNIIYTGYNDVYLEDYTDNLPINFPFHIGDNINKIYIHKYYPNTYIFISDQNSNVFHSIIRYINRLVYNLYMEHIKIIYNKVDVNLLNKLKTVNIHNDYSFIKTILQRLLNSSEETKNKIKLPKVIINELLIPRNGLSTLSSINFANGECKISSGYIIKDPIFYEYLYFYNLFRDLFLFKSLNNSYNSKQLKILFPTLFNLDVNLLHMYEYIISKLDINREKLSTILI